MNACIILEIILILMFAFDCNYKVVIPRVNKKSEKKILLLILMFVILTFFLGLRGDFAEDYKNYKSIFQRMVNLPFNKLIKTLDKDALFYVGTWGLARVSNNEVILFIVTAAITVLGYIVACERYSPIPWLSMFMFITVGDYFNSANLMRNILACGVFCFAIRYAIERKPIKYFIVVVIAGMIHQTALLMIPVYFIFQIKWTKRNYKKILIIYSVSIASVLLIVPRIVSFSLRYMYTAYSSNSAYGMHHGISIVSAIKVISLLAFIIINIKYLDLGKPIENVFFNASVLYLALYLCAMRIQMIQRFAYYFEIGVFILFPKILYSKYRNSVYYKTPLFYTSVILLLTYSILSVGNDPYTWVWQ